MPATVVLGENEMLLLRLREPFGGWWHGGACEARVSYLTERSFACSRPLRWDIAVCGAAVRSA
jgi:hypothetical protein